MVHWAHDSTGVQTFASINCVVGKEILEGAIIWKLPLEEPAWTVRVFIELAMQPALLSFRCLVSGKAVGTTTASYRDVQEPEQPFSAGEASSTDSREPSSPEAEGPTQDSTVDEVPSRDVPAASNTTMEDAIIQPLNRNRVTQDKRPSLSAGARHGRMIHLGKPVEIARYPTPSIARPTSLVPQRQMLSQPYPIEDHRISRSADCLPSRTWE
jgi:hypothetical protein